MHAEITFRAASLAAQRAIFIRIARDQAERKIQSEMLTGLATVNDETQRNVMPAKLVAKVEELKDVAMTRAASEDKAKAELMQQKHMPTLHHLLPNQPHPHLNNNNHHNNNHRHHRRAMQAWQGSLRLPPCSGALP